MTKAELLAAMTAPPKHYHPLPIHPFVPGTPVLPNAGTGLAFDVLKPEVRARFEKALIERAEEVDVCGVLQLDAVLMGAELVKRGFFVGEASSVTAMDAVPGLIMSAEVTIPVWLSADHGDEADIWVRAALALDWSLRPFNKTSVLHTKLVLARSVGVYRSENMWPKALAEFSYPNSTQDEFINEPLDVTRLFAAAMTEQHEKLEDAQRITAFAALARQFDEALAP